MEPGNQNDVLCAKRAIEKTEKRTISVFLLVVGGLLLFWAAEAILYTANVWSKVDTQNAEAVVLGVIGAIVVYYAVRRER